MDLSIKTSTEHGTLRKRHSPDPEVKVTTPRSSPRRESVVLSLSPSPFADLHFNSDDHEQTTEPVVDGNPSNIAATNFLDSSSDDDGASTDGSASSYSDGECSRSSRSRSSSYSTNKSDRSDKKAINTKSTSDKSRSPLRIPSRPTSKRSSPVPHSKRYSPIPHRDDRKELTPDATRKRKASPSPHGTASGQAGLPRVSEDLRDKLLNHTYHIDMADLLPSNTARGRSSNGQNGFSSSRRDPITSFALWTRAYSVFMAYRTLNHPEFVLPMLKYLDLIGLYADEKRGYKLEQWLDYDHYFRRYATSHPEDTKIWSTRHEDSYHRCIAEASRPESANNNRSSDNGNRPSNNERMEPSRNGSRMEPVQSRIAEPPQMEVCLRFNKGNCATPCIRKRRHECLKCHSTGHGKYCCNYKPPFHNGGGGNGRGRRQPRIRSLS